MDPSRSRNLGSSTTTTKQPARPSWLPGLLASMVLLPALQQQRTHHHATHHPLTHICAGPRMIRRQAGRSKRRAKSSVCTHALGLAPVDDHKQLMLSCLHLVVCCAWGGLTTPRLNTRVQATITTGTQGQQLGWLAWNPRCICSPCSCLLSFSHLGGRSAGLLVCVRDAHAYLRTPAARGFDCVLAAKRAAASS